MSKQSTQRIPCPRCGKDISFTRWETISTAEPGAAGDIISGRLFEVACGSCGYRVLVNYPILYNDMEHDVMICNTDPETAGETEKELESMKTLYHGGFRIVFDLASLREKASVFQAGLDDRVTELLKFIVMIQLRPQLEGKKLMGVFFLPGEQPSFEIALEEGSSYVPVTMEMYRSLADQFGDRLEKVQEYYIDQDWAFRFLSAQEKPLS